MSIRDRIYPWLGHEWAEDLLDSIVEQRNVFQVRREQWRIWEGATSWEALGAVTASWCRGELDFTPNHAGPRCNETFEIAETLDHVNRNGLLTTDSQPGMGPVEWRGDTFFQRAAVTGYVRDGDLPRLAVLIDGHGDLTLASHRVNRWRGDFRYAVPVTVDQTWYPHTTFGHVPSRRDVDFEFNRIDEEVVREIQESWSVTLTDTRWGPHRLLWDVLEEL